MPRDFGMVGAFEAERANVRRVVTNALSENRRSEARFQHPPETVRIKHPENEARLERAPGGCLSRLGPEILGDLRWCHAVRNQVDDMRYRDAKTMESRSPAKHLRVVDNPVESIFTGHCDDSTSLPHFQEVLLSRKTRFGRLVRGKPHGTECDYSGVGTTIQ